ncbi:MAG: 4-hydroxy-3-methylbut-2-enyl diphosphate reductase, partial [Muribaculaceae bacterium]|nr:4-hydroxy-3-methylbut-2-enyl diphosphate reductase [Muribaculaceae bacterium]
HDVVLFVAGKKSSNGKVLFGNCLEENANTHLVSNASELRPEWIAGAGSVGICGATSTPRWLMEEVKARAEQIAAEA